MVEGERAMRYGWPRGLLGWLLIHGDRFAEVRDRVEPSPWGAEDRAVFAAMCNLADRDEVIDLVSVAGELRRVGVEWLEAYCSALTDVATPDRVMAFAILSPGAIDEASVYMGMMDEAVSAEVAAGRPERAAMVQELAQLMRERLA